MRKMEDNKRNRINIIDPKLLIQYIKYTGITFYIEHPELILSYFFKMLDYTIKIRLPLLCNVKFCILLS